MIFAKALFFYIKNNAGLSYPIVYGSSTTGIAAPYFVMLPLPGDTEQPVTMDEVQGDAGTLTIQFSLSDDTSTGGAQDKLEALQTFVRSIYGDISYSGSTFNIWENETGGITPLAAVDPVLWDAIFESTLRWERI